jgi:GTPase SAR1 family protein
MMTPNEKPSEIHEILLSVPIQFTGRTQELKEIKDYFDKNHNDALLISGVSGIGKSTLAAAYYHNHFKKYQAVGFFSCVADIFFPVLDLNRTLKLDTTGLNTEQIFKAILKYYTERYTSVLFIFDNVNNATDLQILQNLCYGMRADVLITSTCQGVAENELNITHLEELEATALFKKYCKATEAYTDEKVRQLVGFVQYHTLLIELYAKYLEREAKKGKTIDDVFNMLLEKGFRINDYVELPNNHSKTKNLKAKHTIANILNALFEYSSLSSIEKNLLCFIAVLPTGFYSLDTLQDLVPIKKEDIERYTHALYTQNWLQCEPRGYRMLSLIQDSVQHRFKKESNAARRYTAQRTAEKIGYYLFTEHNFTKVAPYIAIATELIKYQSIEPSTYLYLLYYMSFYYQSQYQYSQARAYAVQANETFEKHRATLSEYYKKRISDNLQFIDDYVFKIPRDNIAPYTEALQNYRTAPQDTELARKVIHSYAMLLENQATIADYRLLQTEVEQIEAIIEAHATELDKNKGLAFAVLLFYHGIIEYYSRHAEVEQIEGYFDKFSLWQKKFKQCYATNSIIQFGMTTICHTYLDFFSEDSSRTDLLQMIAENIAIVHTLCQSDTENTLYKTLLARFYELQGGIYYYRADFLNTEQSWLQAEQIWQELIKKAPEEQGFQNKLARVQEMIALVRILIKEYRKKDYE